MTKPRIEPTLSTTADVRLALNKQGAPLALAQQPAYAAVLAKLAEVDEIDRRIERDEQRDRARARALRPAVISTDNPKLRAARDDANFEALKAGGEAPKHPPASGLAALEQERAVTRSRRIRLNAELREIARDLSHEVDRRNAPQDRSALTKIYEGLALAAEALSTIHLRRARALALGYRPFDGVVLPSGFIASDRIPALAFAIGAPDDIGSELGRYRRWLVDEGIL
jgi:hypothetical protein